MEISPGISEHMLRDAAQNAYSLIVAVDFAANRFTALVHKSLRGTWPDILEGEYKTFVRTAAKIVHPEDMQGFKRLANPPAAEPAQDGKEAVIQELLRVGGSEGTYHKTEAIRIPLRLYGDVGNSCLILLTPFESQTLLQERFETLLSNIKGGVICCRFSHRDNKLETLYMSDGWEELTGYSMREMQEKFDNNPKLLIVEEDRERVNSSYLIQLRNGNTYELQYRIKRRDGKIAWIIDRGITSSREAGFTENQSILTDVTSVKENEERLRISEERFRISTRASGAAVFEFDLYKKQYIHFENAHRLFSMSDKEALRAFNAFYQAVTSDDEGNPASDLLHPDDRGVYKQLTKDLLESGTAVCEARFRKKDGVYIWCAVNRTIIKGLDGRAIRVVGNITDIDLSRKHTEQLKRQVETEPLTGLTNKPAAARFIADILKTHSNSLHALMALDIDNFKGINDTMGHTFGDTVLIDVSQKLKKLFRAGDIVARTGGDEFIVFMPDLPSQEIAVEKARKICETFRYTYAGEKTEYKISCSLGLVFSTGGETFETLFEKADIAMYDSKSGGKDRFSVYEGDRKNLAAVMRRGARNVPETRGVTLSLNERIFELLYGTEDFTVSVNMVLALLGRYANASRVYVFENTPDGSSAVNTFEWCNENIPSMTSVPGELEIKADFDYYSLYDKDNVFHCEAGEKLPPLLQTIAEKRAVQTVTQIAIRENGAFRGFIGYDYCSAAAKSAKELETLSLASKILGTFVLKKRAEEAILLSSKNKVHAMDNLPAPVYVIDENFTLRYFNRETQRIIPAVRIGDNCYKLFMQRETPCTACPAQTCGSGTANCELINPLGMHLAVTASKIIWSGKQMFLLSCQDFTRYVRK